MPPIKWYRMLAYMLNTSLLSFLAFYTAAESFDLLCFVSLIIIVLSPIIAYSFVRASALYALIKATLKTLIVNAATSIKYYILSILSFFTMFFLVSGIEDNPIIRITFGEDFNLDLGVFYNVDINFVFYVTFFTMLIILFCMTIYVIVHIIFILTLVLLYYALIICAIFLLYKLMIEYAPPSFYILMDALFTIIFIVILYFMILKPLSIIGGFILSSLLFLFCFVLYDAIATAFIEFIILIWKILTRY